MIDLLDLLRRGSLVICTLEQTDPSGREVGEAVAATLFCRDGRTVQLLRRDALTRFPAVLRTHQAKVAARMSAFARDLRRARYLISGVVMSGALAVAAGKTDWTTLRLLLRGSAPDLWRATLGLAWLVLPPVLGAVLSLVLRRALRHYLKTRLAGA